MGASSGDINCMGRLTALRSRFLPKTQCSVLCAVVRSSKIKEISDFHNEKENQQ